jgi:hypothetical protein
MLFLEKRKPYYPRMYDEILNQTTGKKVIQNSFISVVIEKVDI